MDIDPKLAELCERNETDYSDLKAFFINCTLKRSPEQSHTQGLMDISMEMMRRVGVEVGGIRAIDHEIAYRGVAGHDRARLGVRRVARDLRARHGRRHPGAWGWRSGWARRHPSRRR